MLTDKWSQAITNNSNWDTHEVAPETEGPRFFPRSNKLAAPRFALGDVPTMVVNNNQRTAKNDTWYKWLPFFHKAVVIAQPAISPTGSVMQRNSWDWKFGIIGSYKDYGPIVPSNVNLPVAPIPKTGM